MAPQDSVTPRSVAVAGWALVLVGVANAMLGLAGLTVASDEVGTGVAAGLVGAGAATSVVGRLVLRGSRRALVVALVVFEGLLVVRLLTLSDGATGQGPSLVVLAGLVATLVVATIQLRRRDRAERVTSPRTAR